MASHDDLQATVQRQADTIEALHAASAQYKARAESAEQLASGRISEADTIRQLQHECQTFKSENFSLNERVKELEAAITRTAEANSLTAESQAQLGVQVRAYQRHNHFLQGEVSARDAKQRALEERVEFLQEEVKTKERRMGLMMERLRKHNVDMAHLGEHAGPSGTLPARVTVPEATLQQIREQMAVQTSTIEVLRERLESLEDESSRKEQVLKSLRRENDALKGTISKMVAQVKAEVTSSASDMHMAVEGFGTPSSSSKELFDGTGSNLLMGLGGSATGNPAIAQQAANHTGPFSDTNDDVEKRVAAFRNRRLQDFASASPAASSRR